MGSKRLKSRGSSALVRTAHGAHRARPGSGPRQVALKPGRHQGGGARQGRRILEEVVAPGDDLEAPRAAEAGAQRLAPPPARGGALPRRRGARRAPPPPPPPP